MPSPGVPVSPPSTVPPSEPAPPAVHDVGTSLVPDAAPGVGLNGADYCVHPVGVEVLWDDAGLEVLSERVIYADGCDQ